MAFLKIDKNRFGFVQFIGFIKRVILAVFVFMVTYGFIVPKPALWAGEQAQRAIAAVHSLRAEGRLPNNAVIRIMAKSGNISNLLGRDFVLKTQWEEATGVLLDSRTRPNLPVFELMRNDTTFDITVARQREYPDLIFHELIADLTPLVRKHGFELPGPQRGHFIAPRRQSLFNDKVVAVPADGDIALLYVRRDLLQDPAEQAAFEKRYGRKLNLPKTWDDYLTLIEFFHRPQQGLYGTVEQRDPDTGWMFWMPRYASQAHPNQYLFDDQMHPLIDSPAGYRATRQYVSTVQFSPPGILKNGNGYTYTVPIFRNGQAFSSMLTLAMAKILNRPGSSVKTKFATITLPGTWIDNRLVRRSSFIYGNNLVVAKASRNQELAFLFAMWLTDPDISTESLLASGHADPYRFNHLTEQRVIDMYTAEALAAFEAQVDSTIPDGTGIPGDHEYIQALSNHLLLAAEGRISPEAAMKQTARQWDVITDKYGRKQQAAYWQKFKSKYPVK